jgi:lipoprotein-anchoring transpeptidase ErfK/SrfK
MLCLCATEVSRFDKIGFCFLPAEMRVPSALCLPVLFWTGCQTIPERATYNPVDSKPRNANNVVIEVSLRNRMAYVMEGDRPLLVTATAIGTPSNPTPKGRFRVTRKIANKRSNTYSFWVNGDTIVPGKSSQWMPAYGFYVGSVWSIPRTHGCLRLHQSAAREFFELARVGTPVYIAENLA